MMSALEAAASITSLSVMPPTPAWMTATFTSSFDSLTSDCFTASAEPCTSALTMMLKVLMPLPI